MARLHFGHNGRSIVASSLSVSYGARDIGFVGASRPPFATCVASRHITEPRSVHTHAISAARRMRHFVILRSNQLTTKPIAVGRRTRPIIATDAAGKILTAVNAGATRRYYYTLSSGSQACDMQLAKLQIKLPEFGIAYCWQSVSIALLTISGRDPGPMPRSMVGKGRLGRDSVAAAHFLKRVTNLAKAAS